MTLPVRDPRALFDPMERNRRSSSLVWSHFLRRTGIHFVGKCSRSEQKKAARRVIERPRVWEETPGSGGWCRRMPVPTGLYLCCNAAVFKLHLRPSRQRHPHGGAFHPTLTEKQNCPTPYVLLSDNICVKKSICLFYRLFPHDASGSLSEPSTKEKGPSGNRTAQV